MNKEPLVSIIVPAFNHEHFIFSTIQSLVAQTYSQIEIIIIDDGSADGTLNLAESFAEKYSHISVYHQDNQGLSQTLNNGLRKAHGKYVSLIASDDLMDPYKIEDQVNFLESHPQYSLVAGGYQCIDSSGNYLNQPRFPSSFPAEICGNVFKGCLFHTMTALYRRDDLFNVGLFRPGVINEDWYIQIMLRQAGLRFYSIPNVVCFYRIHSNNTHSDLHKSIRAKKQLANLFSMHERLQIILASYVHAFYLSMQYQSPILNVHWIFQLILHSFLYRPIIFLLKLRSKIIHASHVRA